MGDIQVYVHVFEAFLFIVCLYLVYRGCKQDMEGIVINNNQTTRRREKYHKKCDAHIEIIHQSTQVSPPKYKDVVQS